MKNKSIRNNIPVPIELIIDTNLYNTKKEIEKLKDISGIYFIKFYNNIIYIGSSKNLMQRLLSHYNIIKKENPNNKNIIQIYYIKIEDKELMVSLERLLISMIQPEKNILIDKHNFKDGIIYFIP